MQGVLIAVVTGAASALMFASSTSGSMLSAILVWMSPLPIMIAALGWGSMPGLLSAAAAALAIGLILNPATLIVFLIAIALPAWWLGHLAMLAQPSPRDPKQFDWYPVGRILMWIIAIVAACGLLALVLSSTDSGLADNSPRQEMTQMLRASGWLPPGADPAPVIDAVFRLLPAMLAFMGVVALTFNLWVAGHVVRLSQRLRRPWPSLRAVALPQAALAALAAAVIAAVIDESIAPFSRMVIGALLAAYLLLGLAVIHSVTARLGSRALWLGAVYFILLFALPVAGLTAIAIALLGIAEQLFGFREQFAQRLPPPTA
jgi:magnesium-transporting ATPase (P-type)